MIGDKDSPVIELIGGKDSPVFEFMGSNGFPVFEFMRHNGFSGTELREIMVFLVLSIGESGVFPRGYSMGGCNA